VIAQFPRFFFVGVGNGYCGRTVVVCVAERRSKKI
jgi:hypothetical protein